MNLARLAEPFPAEDIEWRVSRAGMGKKGVYCHCIPFITARAVYSRLDDVCTPAGWRNEPPQIHELRTGVKMIVVGISIKVGDEWITKWDCSEPTNIEPAKGGFSGASKRAGAQWGIGRYLYYLDEAFAEVSDTGGKGWNYAQLSEKHGRAEYYWRPPQLPAWALPKEIEHAISEAELAALKKEWLAKFAPASKNPAELREGFTRFVASVVGEFPAADFTCWTRDALERCAKRIEQTTDPQGVSADVPFE